MKSESVNKIITDALNEVKNKHGIIISGLNAEFIVRGATNEDETGKWSVSFIARSTECKEV